MHLITHCRRKRFALAIVSISLVVSLISLPFFMSIVTIPETEGTWFRSGPYRWNGNISYSVMFHGVNFTFLYYIHEGVLDRPCSTHFEVTFVDSIREHLDIGIGGWCFGPRVVLSNHTSPRIAIYTSDSGEYDLHYTWFLAVSLSQ